MVVSSRVGFLVGSSGPARCRTAMSDSEIPRPVPDAIELALNAELSEDALAQLFRESWPAAGERSLEAELEHSLCWVSARLGERLIGFVNVAWNGGQHAFLLDPVVHP